MSVRPDLKNRHMMRLQAKNSVKTEKFLIDVCGRGVTLEWTSISERKFKRLTVNGVDNDDVRSHFARCKGIGGAVNGRCGIYVNDRKVKGIRLGLKRAEVERIGRSSKYLLVTETWEKGDFVSAEIEGKFDKRKLSLGLTRYRLNDGTTYDLVSFGYDADDEPEFESDTDSKETNYFVVTREGKRHPVKFKGD